MECLAHEETSTKSAIGDLKSSISSSWKVLKKEQKAIEERYPLLFKGRFKGHTSRFFEKIRVSCIELEYILQMYGLNLQNAGIVFDYKYPLMEIPTYFYDAIAHPEDFQESTHKFFTAFPCLWGKINLKELRQILWSFSRKKNLDEIIELNQSYKKVWIQEWDFQIEDVSSKIATLKTLENEKFPDFLEKWKIFKNRSSNFPIIDWHNDIWEMELIFHFIQKNSKYEEILFSRNFHTFCTFLLKQVNFSEMKNHNMKPIIGLFLQALPIIKDFPYEKFKKIKDELEKHGEKLVANDILLILEIIKYPHLMDRVSKDLSKTIENIKSKLGKEIRRRWWSKKYTERPDISKLPFLDILRISILQENLWKTEFLDDLTQIITADLNDDPNYEHGGIISFRRQRIKLLDIPNILTESTIPSYNNDRYHGMHGGITRFHAHAIKVNSRKYAGPSGYEKQLGDFSIVNIYNAPSIVYTSLWYVKNKNWENILPYRIEINIDYYFIDKRDPKKHKQIVVDLGVVEIPFKK